MKAQFIVTIEGNWRENGKPITTAMAEKLLRKAVKEEFEFLADRVTVNTEAKPKRTQNTATDVMTDAEVFANQLAQM